MRKILVFTAVLVLLAVTSFAADTAAWSPAGQMIRLPGPNGEASGYLAVPSKPAPKKPAIILIQEWWGLTDWIKQDADRYAAKGYVVLAPDLYRGHVAADADEAHQLMRGLPEDRALADMKAAFEFLAARKDVDSKRIGIAGWCMGGGYALTLGIEEPRLAAVIVNYGRLVTDPNTIRKIKAPVMGNFGGADKGIPPEDVKKFAQQLAEFKIGNDFKIYDGAGHAFMNPNNKTGYDAAAAEDAWKRMDSFFEKNLLK